MADLVRHYVVYFDALDFPGKYVLRGHTVTGQGPIPDAEPLAVTDTLEGARLALPIEADYRLERDPEDEAQIVELWI